MGPKGLTFSDKSRLTSDMICWSGGGEEVSPDMSIDKIQGFLPGVSSRTQRYSATKKKLDLISTCPQPSRSQKHFFEAVLTHMASRNSF